MISCGSLNILLIKTPTGSKLDILKVELGKVRLPPTIVQICNVNVELFMFTLVLWCDAST